MIGHIFAKDLRRLWPFVAGLGVLDVLLAAMRVALGFFPEEHSPLLQVSNLLDGLCFLLMFFVPVLVVQLDPIPDDRQDWLVRPIRRRDLLAAKLLFVVITVHLPLFAANLGQGLASGFPFGQAFAAAAWWNLYQFAGLTLPALAVASLTRTVGQTLGLVLAIAALVGLLVLLPNVTNYLFLLLPRNSANTLLAWLLRYGLLLAGVATILGLQYFRRRTIRARVALAVFMVLIVASQMLLPNSTALAMQNWMTPEQTATVAFAPQAGRQIAPSRDIPYFEPQGVDVALPMQARDLAPGLVLVSEGANVVVTAPDGRSTNNDFEISDSVIRAPGLATYYQRLRLPRTFLRAHAGQKMRIDIDYTLSILRLRALQTMRADGGDVWLAEGAHCASRIAPNDEARLDVECLQAGNVSQRAVGSLVDAASGQPLRWATRHLPSDAPYSNGSDMITRFALGGFSLNGLESLQMPKVAVTLAQPVAHVMRHITISDVRLEDWIVNDARNNDARNGEAR